MAILPGGLPLEPLRVGDFGAALVAREGLDGPSLVVWMGMTQEEFSARFRGSPVVAEQSWMPEEVEEALAS